LRVKLPKGISRAMPFASKNLSQMLTVVQMSGEDIAIDAAALPPDCTVFDIKKHLSLRLSCPTFRVMLLHGDVVLDSGDCWHSLGRPTRLAVVQSTPAEHFVHTFSNELLEAVSKGDTLQVDKVLSQGQCPNTLAFGGETVLFAAARNGHLDVARSLLGAGANLHRQIRRWFTPLYIASWQGHLEIVRLFVEAGAVPDQGLCAAVFRGHLEVARFLVEHGADVQAVDEQGQTPLNLAAAQGHLDLVRLLVGAKAKMALDEVARGPLHRAVEGGHLDVVQYLLQEGADFRQTNSDGISPLQAAREGGHTAIVELLEGLLEEMPVPALFADRCFPVALMGMA